MDHVVEGGEIHHLFQGRLAGLILGQSSQEFLHRLGGDVEGGHRVDGDAVADLEQLLGRKERRFPCSTMFANRGTERVLPTVRISSTDLGASKKMISAPAFS